MSALLIWMNSQEAKVFHLQPTTIHVERILFQGPHPGAESSGGSASGTPLDMHSRYGSLAEALHKSAANQFLLMGPSPGPRYFDKFLRDRHPLLSSKVIGVEKVDEMPDSEILSVGRSYLHHYYLRGDQAD